MIIVRCRVYRGFFISQAREYWKGNMSNELPELLINGKIEVIEIIEEFPV